MRIILFLNKDLEANLAYNLLKRELERYDVRIYYSNAVGNPHNKPAALLEIERYEKDFFFEHIAATLQEIGADTGFEFFGDGFSSVPMQQCRDVNSESFISEVEAFAPDLFIAIRFGKIFKPPIIRVPKMGVLNLHSAVLPDYKGILGTLHALKAGEQQVGCTVHTINDAGIDTGDIMVLEKMPVDLGRSLFWHVARLYPAGCQALAKVVSAMANGERPEAMSQQDGDGKYFSVPSQHDFDVLQKQGYDTINAQDYLDVLQEFVMVGLDDAQAKLLEQLVYEEMGDV